LIDTADHQPGSVADNGAIDPDELQVANDLQVELCSDRMGSPFCGGGAMILLTPARALATRQASADASRSSVFATAYHADARHVG